MLSCIALKKPFIRRRQLQNTTLRQKNDRPIFLEPLDMQGLLWHLSCDPLEKVGVCTTVYNEWQKNVSATRKTLENVLGRRALAADRVVRASWLRHVHC